MCQLQENGSAESGVVLICLKSIDVAVSFLFISKDVY